VYNIGLLQNLFIGGNLVVGFGGAGQHTVSRNGSERNFVRGNLQVGTSNLVNNSISALGANGGEIVMQGNAISTSTMSSFFTGELQAKKCWCNIDVTIDAGANTIQLSATNDFNFGNPLASALNPRRFKYTSGTFTTTGSTINLANSILDMDNAQLIRFNNVRIYSFANILTVTNVQLQKDTRITGNLITGFIGQNMGGGTSIFSLPSLGTATTFTIGGGLIIGNAADFGSRSINPFSSPTISLNLVGSGTIEGNAMCNANINLNGTAYTMNDFQFGNLALAPTNTPIFKYNSGTITCTGTLYTTNAKLDLAAVQLNNLAPMSATGGGNGGTYTLTILANNILRVNGNYTTGITYLPTPSNLYGSTFLNRDATTLSAQLDVYGSVNMSSQSVPLTSTTGTCPIYMKGTGNLTTNGQPFCGVDIFINGNTTTLLNFWIGGSKRLEYISGTLITTNSLTSIPTGNIATIKSLGQTWGDIGIRGGAILIADGNLTCRDLITYNDANNCSIQGEIAGRIVTIKRNLTIGSQALVGTPTTPIDKLVMDATDGGTGTWTSGTGQLRISLDLNAPSRTILVSGTVNFGNAVTQRLRWFAGTTMNTAGSTLVTGNSTLDLGNQVWGGLTTGSVAVVHFESDATFTNVNLTGGTSTYLNGISAARNLTVQNNLSISQPTATFTGFQLVNFRFDGDGSWTNGASGYLNANCTLVSGTRTLVGTVVWGNNALGIGGDKTFNATGGTLVGGASTFSITNNNTITVDKTTRGSFHNVTTSANATITLNAQMGITGTLTLNSTALNVTTFASSSTFGWDAVNFTHGGGTSICILNAGSTYNISGTFQMLGSNDASRATLRSSKLSLFTNATANGTLLSTSSGVGGSPVEVGMELSQASVVASGGFAAIYPNRPILTSAGTSPFSLNATFPVNPSTGPVNMEAGVKANLNLAVGTGVPLILFAIVKDINSIGGQTIYAFQTYLDAPSNPQANMFRTINWNTLAPPVSPIGIGYLSVT
jgi:hypothetical protein